MTARGDGDLSRLENRFPIRSGHHPPPDSPHRKAGPLLLDCAKSLVRTDMGRAATVIQKSVEWPELIPSMALGRALQEGEGPQENSELLVGSPKGHTR